MDIAATTIPATIGLAFAIIQSVWYNPPLLAPRARIRSIIPLVQSPSNPLLLQRCDVAGVQSQFLGFQQAAHYFAAAGFGEGWGKVDFRGDGYGA